MKYFMEKYSSPIGDLYLVATEDALHCVAFEGHWVNVNAFSKSEVKANSLLIETKRQLDEYFAGKRYSFDLPLSLQGTPFQRRTWLALQQIPYGETITYKDQAHFIDSPKAFRAVGLTNGRNPICLVLPCHRVIGSNGTITGYAGGVEIKKFLLSFESQQSKNRKWR